MINPTDFKKIVVLTGAGISQESGLSTFRDAGGLWEKYPLEEVATPEAFESDPTRVWRFYSLRKIYASKAKPNPAHQALAHFYKKNNSILSLTIITQNVDLLHQQCDPDHLMEIIPMHGSLNQSRCTHCDQIYFDDNVYFNEQESPQFSKVSLCSKMEVKNPFHLDHFKLSFKHHLPLSPCCQKLLRPHIVWFGEEPQFLKKIFPLIEKSDLFVSIGTSGSVFPAAGFLKLAKSKSSTTVCLNKEEIPQSPVIDYFIQGNASEIVPAFFK